ncbi:hypothetical protein L1887_31108 [Cichorium endivia]|nr:hypothetical protein L1887_31108 [Cichorium endivia]
MGKEFFKLTQILRVYAITGLLISSAASSDCSLLRALSLFSPLVAGLLASSVHCISSPSVVGVLTSEAQTSMSL